MPFDSALQLGIHFHKHGHEFGLANAADYERMADAFMFGGMNANTQECIRPNRRRKCRLDFVAQHFGVSRIRPQIVVTFYVPGPGTIRKHRGLPGLFAFECGRNE